MQIEYTTRIHREDKLYVAHAPELDVSSAGNTVEEAHAHLREAVTLFLEEAERMGTLTAILEEAAYTRVGNRWQPPEVISTERNRLTVAAGTR